jgi:hypothetical protein
MHFDSFNLFNLIKVNMVGNSKKRRFVGKTSDE